jgi:hypothetical protein
VEAESRANVRIAGRKDMGAPLVGRGFKMIVRLDVFLRPSSNHMWTLYDSDGRVLLTDRSLEEIAKVVLYLQAKFTIEGIVQT